MTIDQTFANLTGRLMGLLSCTAETALVDTSEIFDPIPKQIFSFPPAEALIYINAALYTIQEIESKGLEILNNYLLPEEGIVASIDELGHYYMPDQVSERKFIVLRDFIRPELEKYRSQLVQLKQLISERSSQLGKPVIDKMELKLSIEEIATLFRAFIEVGIVNGENYAETARLIKQYFYTKRTKDIKIDYLRDSIYKPSSSSINNIRLILKKANDALDKLSE